MSSTNNVATAGACSGQGANGIAPITNLVLNPSLEFDASDWFPRWDGNSGGSSAFSRPTAGGVQGAAFIRKSWTASGIGQDVGFDTGTDAAHHLPVAPSTSYYASAYMRTNRSDFRPYVWMCWYDSSGTLLNGGNCMAANTGLTLTPNTWTRFGGTLTSPASAASVALVFSNVADPAGWTVGDTLDLDGAMLVQTTAPSINYADGSSPNWVWNGTSNASTSTGPPL